MHTTLCIHSLMHLCGFHITALRNSAAVNVVVQVSLRSTELNSLGLIPRRVELDQLLLVLRSLHSGCTAFYSHQQECGLLWNISHILSKIYEHFKPAFLMAFFPLWSWQWLHPEWSEGRRMLIFSILSHGRQRMLKVSSKSGSRRLYRWLAGESTCRRYSVRTWVRISSPHVRSWQVGRHRQTTGLSGQPVESVGEIQALWETCFNNTRWRENGRWKFPIFTSGHHRRLHVHTSRHMHMHIHAHILTHACGHGHAHTGIDVCIHTCIHAYIHTCTC